MIAFGLVGIGGGELRKGRIEQVILAEISAHQAAFPGPRVCPRQSPSADPDVFEPITFSHVFQINFHFHQPWLMLDLACPTSYDVVQEFLIDSARVLFTIPGGRRQENPPAWIRQYKIEVSSDGKTFATVVDKTKNAVDNVIEFDEIAPIQCRYVKLTITGWPKGLPIEVSEFTVFGKPGASHPQH